MPGRCWSAGCRAGRRRRGRRPPVRRGQPLGTPRRDPAAAAGGHPGLLSFPGEAGHVRYGEGIFVGYRGYDKLDRQVSYPFGHGLSYTSFDYADLTTNITGSHRDNDLVVAVTCRVTNTGDRRGKEVVQLYVRDPEASVARPVRELKAFARSTSTPARPRWWSSPSRLATCPTGRQA